MIRGMTTSIDYFKEEKLQFYYICNLKSIEEIHYFSLQYENNESSCFIPITL